MNSSQLQGWFSEQKEMSARKEIADKVIMGIVLVVLVILTGA